MSKESARALVMFCVNAHTNPKRQRGILALRPRWRFLKMRKVEFAMHSAGRVSRPDQKWVEIDGPGAPSCEKAQRQNWRFGLV